MAAWEILPGDADDRPVLMAGDKTDVANGVFEEASADLDEMLPNLAA